MTEQAPPIQRAWMPYAKAAKFYVGIAPDVLLAAIKRKELKAYEKPITRHRREGAQRQNHSYFVYLGDVDQWIRTYWPEAFSTA